MQLDVGFLEHGPARRLRSPGRRGPLPREQGKSCDRCAGTASFALEQPPAPRRKRICGSWTTKPRATVLPVWTRFSKVRKQNIDSNWKPTPPSCATFRERTCPYAWLFTIPCCRSWSGGREFSSFVSLVIEIFAPLVIGVTDHTH